MPARRHHLLHQKRCGNGFQKVVHRHLHIGLIGIRHSYHVHKLSRFLAFAITGASSDNLHHFGQRATHTDGQTFLTPLPVETFLGSTQSDDNIYIITLLYPLQISLHQIASLGVVFHQIGNLQQSAVLGSDVIDAAIVVIPFLYLTDNLDDFIHLRVFTQTAGCSGVDTRNMDDGLLGSIQHLGNMVEITAVIEVIAQDEVLEIAITVELLIIVVGYREETGLIFCPQYRNTIASEVTARHGNNMTGGIIHHPAHNIAQSAVHISTCMMKLIYRQEAIIKLLVTYFLHAVS